MDSANRTTLGTPVRAGITLVLVLLVGATCGAKDDQATATTTPTTAATTTTTIPSTTTTMVSIAALTSWADRVFKYARATEAERKLAYSLGDFADTTCKFMVDDAQKALTEVVPTAPDPALGVMAAAYFNDVLGDASLSSPGAGCPLAVREKGDGDPHQIMLLLVELEQRGVNLEPLGASSTLGLGLA